MMKKRVLSLILATALAVTALAGCGQKNGTESKVEVVSSETTAASESTAPVEESSNFNEEGYPIVNEEITLKVLIAVRDNDNLTDLEDMPVLQRLEEQTGIKVEWEAIKASEWDTKLNLIMVSGEYPDIIIGHKGGDISTEQYGVDQKILIPLDDLIEKYAPLYTERIAMEEKDPTANLVASDGQTYTMGFYVATGATIARHYFIKQNWLDALNLEMPKDLDSLTNVLRAFKTQDPNGNGEADEIPIVSSLDQSATYCILPFLSMFGVPYRSESWLYIDDNKQVQFVPTQDGYRECMEWLHMCYEEGLLDTEVVSQDGKACTAKIAEDKAGFFIGHRLHGSNIDSVADDYVLYMPWEGTVFSNGISGADPSVYFTCTNQYPEASMRWVNAWLEVETAFSMYYGEYNEEQKSGVNGWYYGEDGKIVSTGASSSGASNAMDYLGVNGIFFAPVNWYFAIYNQPLSRTEKMEFVKAYIDAGLTSTTYSHSYLDDHVKFDVEELTIIERIATDINNAVNEHMATFVVDGVTDASWDKYVKLFEGMNVAEYMKMYQEKIDALEIK